MLKFEPLGKFGDVAMLWRMQGPNRLKWIIATPKVIDVDGMWLETPADLAELRRVLAEAEKIVGWKGE